MPLIMCYTRAGLDVGTKAKLAAAITDKVHGTIKSDFYHISVIFSDLASESSYVAGKPGNDTTPRHGRSHSPLARRPRTTPAPTPSSTS